MTPRMKQALEAITVHVGLHGVMPSRAMLASALACNKNNANRLMQSLVERGEINSMTPGGALTGFGRDGVAIFIPTHLAAQLASFCATNSEKVQAVVVDAIALHLDHLGEVIEP